MINVYSFNAITQAMDLAKANNLKIVTCQDSPVDLLNRAASGPSLLNAAITDEEFIHRLPDELKIGAVLGEAKEVAYVKDGGHASLVPISEHEMTLRELVKMATARLSGLLDFSRNVAQPFVRSVIEQINEPAVAEVQEEWSLVPVALDSIFDAPVVQGLLKSVPNLSVASYEYDALEGLKVPDNLPVPVTGSKAYDDLIVILLNDLKTTPTELMTKAIVGGGVNPYRPESWRYVKEHVATMLLAAFYVENPWEGSGVTSTKWDVYLPRVSVANIAWLMAYLNQLNEKVKAGQTVLSIDGDAMNVYVCQEVFSAYIEQGGCAEALLGAVYTQESEDAGPVSTNIAYLLEQQNELVAAWSRRSAVTKAAMDTDWVNAHRTNLKNSFYQQIGAAEAGHLGFAPDVARKQCSESIDKCFGRQTADITEFAIEVAARDVFGDESVGRILKAIHRGMKDGVEPDVAARDELVEYVLDWVLGSLYVE